jgi:uncharacterized protein DUF1707
MLSHPRSAAMRTSDAERRRAADFLRDACADGRLSPEELEARLDHLFSGGTVADIERLVWDLPGGGAVVPRLVSRGRAPVHAPVRRRPASPIRPGAVALVLLGLVALILAALPPFFAVVALALLIATGVAVAALVAALAPAGLLLFGLAWLANRLWRGRVHGQPWHWHAGGPRGRHHPFG